MPSGYSYLQSSSIANEIYMIAYNSANPTIHALFCKNIDSGSGWTTMTGVPAGPYLKVAAGATLLILTTPTSQSVMYTKKRSCDAGAWKTMNGHVTDVAIGNTHIWGINGGDAIWSCAISSLDYYSVSNPATCTWTAIPGVARYVATGGGWVFVVNASGGSFRGLETMTTNGWQPLAAPLASGLAANDGLLQLRVSSTTSEYAAGTRAVSAMLIFIESSYPSSPGWTATITSSTEVILDMDLE